MRSSFAEFGYVETRTPKIGYERQHRLNGKLGFVRTGEDEYNVHYRLDRGRSAVEEEHPMPVAQLPPPLLRIGATGRRERGYGRHNWQQQRFSPPLVPSGAVVGTIGYFTKSKELTIAGSILGGIGAIGGFASGVGLFGAGGGSSSVLGPRPRAAAASVGDEAGSWASEIAPIAGEGVTATAAPAGGYTLEALANSGLEGGIAGFGEAGGVGITNVDIIELGNGVGDANFNPLTPAEQLGEA